MQRIRMSLPYFKDYGWEAEVVAVDPDYANLPKDSLLLNSLPPDVPIHYVKALDIKWTSKIGFGGLAYRSYQFYKRKVNQLLNEKKFDLVYFSTTAFPICILGAYWKKRFKIPYVIDMQDPWHSDYYQDKPKEQRPKKYWLSYRMNKYSEPIAMKQVGGLISVSESYIDILKKRYPQIKSIPASTITFGAFKPDMEIALQNKDKFESLLKQGYKSIVYIGRGGMDMHNALKPVFETFKKLIGTDPDVFKTLRFYFIGTSYAPRGQGKATILPLVIKYGIEDYVTEITERIGYYHTLSTLKQADALFIPGSDDPKYTASKIYPYLLTYKPLLAIFNSQSSAMTVLKEFGVNDAYSYDNTPDLQLKIANYLRQIAVGNATEIKYNHAAIEKYSAQVMTKNQCDLFNRVV